MTGCLERVLLLRGEARKEEGLLEWVGAMSRGRTATDLVLASRNGDKPSLKEEKKMFLLIPFSEKML